MAKLDVTDLIERMQEQEEQAGIELRGLLAILDETGYGGEPRLQILGEIVGRGGERFRADVRVQFVSLNERGQVLGVGSCSVSKGDTGYEAFEEAMDLHGRPSRIKVVPLFR